MNYIFRIELFKYFFVIASSNCELFKFISNSFEEKKIKIKWDIEQKVCLLSIDKE